MIRVKSLFYYTFKTRKLLVSVPFMHLEAGRFHVFLGPNGAGKSTLLRCLCGDLKRVEGELCLAERAVKDYALDELARRRAVLPQLSALPFAVSVRDIVSFGRDIYRNRPESRCDKSVVEWVMRQMEVSHLADANYQTLSGGEQHRAQIARTLAQVIAEPDEDLHNRILFLDEPTNHLDIRYQYGLMRLLGGLKERGLTVVCVLHDIALALNYADTLLLLKEGETVGHFHPRELVDSDALNDAYGMNLGAHWSTHYQRYLVIPNEVFPEAGESYHVSTLN